MELEFETRTGRTVIEYGRAEGSDCRAVRNSPLSDPQLMELSEYFGVEVSQSVIEQRGVRRAVVRLGVRDSVSIESINTATGEQIVDVVHSHQGHSLVRLRIVLVL